MYHLCSFKTIRKMLSLFLPLVLLLQSYLISCSKNTTNPPQPLDRAIPTIMVNGIMDGDEIIGNDLSLLNAWEKKSISSDSGFIAEVSDSAAQLLTIIDADDKVRGLFISSPNALNAKSSELLFDGTSTARALVLLTPGIITNHRDSIDARLDQIEALPGFPLFDSLLTENMKVMPVIDAKELTEVRSAFNNCVNQFFEQAGKSPLKMPGYNPNYWYHFKVFLEDYSDPSNVTIRLENHSARVANVYRRTLDKDGNTISAVSLFTSYSGMMGIDPYYYGMFGEPEIKYDHLNLQCGTGIKNIEYWTTGLGWLQYHADFPDSLWPEYENDRSIVVGMTILNNLIRPFLSLVGGFIIDSKSLSIIQEEAAYMEAYTEFAMAQNAEELEAAYRNIAMVMFSLAIIAISFTYPLIGIIWGLIGSAQSYVTFFGSLLYLAATPAVDVFSAHNPISQTDCLPAVIVTTPADNQTGVQLNSPITATFSTDMDPSTIDDASFTIDNEVTGTITYDSLFRTAIFIPDTILQKATTYNAIIHNSVTDTNGLNMVDDYSWDFTTLTGNELWTITLSVGDTLNRGITCATGSHCDCSECPSNSEAWLLSIGNDVIFNDIDLDPSLGTFSHSSDGWGVGMNFGTFQLASGSVDLSGTVSDDTYDFSLTFSGYASYGPCPLFDSPGSFSCIFTVSDATRTGNTITGEFSVNATISTPDGNCADFVLSEQSNGTVSVQITDAKSPGNQNSSIQIVSQK